MLPGLRKQGVTEGSPSATEPVLRVGGQNPGVCQAADGARSGCWRVRWRGGGGQLSFISLDGVAFLEER